MRGERYDRSRERYEERGSYDRGGSSRAYGHSSERSSFEKMLERRREMVRVLQFGDSQSSAATSHYSQPTRIVDFFFNY